MAVEVVDNVEETINTISVVLTDRDERDGHSGSNTNSVLDIEVLIIRDQLSLKFN